MDQGEIGIANSYFLCADPFCFPPPIGSQPNDITLITVNQGYMILKPALKDYFKSCLRWNSGHYLMLLIYVSRKCVSFHNFSVSDRQKTE